MSTPATGAPSPLDAEFAVVYGELHAIAHRQLRRGDRDGTLTTTALVHEVYLKLSDSDATRWCDRSHFLALASRSMRFILVDYARSRMADRRGGGQAVVTFDDDAMGNTDRPEELLAINDALERLGKVSERLSLVVQYRFFGGLSLEEIGELLGVSVPTVKRDWVRARVWLYKFMQDGRGSAAGTTGTGGALPSAT